MGVFIKQNNQLVPVGFSNKVSEASLQAKTNITPTTSSQTITPDSGYDGLSSVQVNGDVNLTAGNIKKDVSIFNVTGTYEGSGGLSGVSVTITDSTLLAQGTFYYLDQYGLFSSGSLQPDPDYTSLTWTGTVMENSLAIFFSNTSVDNIVFNVQGMTLKNDLSFQPDPRRPSWTLCKIYQTNSAS